MFLINKIKFALINRNYQSKVKYLRSLGASIGENTRLISGVECFGSEPYLVTVGANCLFSSGIHIVTHDGGISVLNNLGCFGDKKMDKMARVKIGDNVFIGTRTIVMPGVTIGSNVIIGAGSIVSRDIPDNTVAAGCPAKPIKTIDEYCEKLKAGGMLFSTAGMSAEEKKAFLLNALSDKT